MATQTREQGRYLGGRPPYGYRLADAGPHPNKAHAAWGRRAHRLEPDPDTAPVVAWMFAQRLAGHSAARITRALNDAGIPANLYIREDQILPRLAALAILQSEGSRSPRDRKLASAQVTAPAQAAELIDRLRAADVTLIYDPATRALRTDTKDAPAVTVG